MFVLFENEAWRNVYSNASGEMECTCPWVSHLIYILSLNPSLMLRQHLDDCAESFLMSAFHNSQLFTMKANYWNKEKDLRIIRPLVYVRETETRKFAEGSKETVPTYTVYTLVNSSIVNSVTASGHSRKLSGLFLGAEGTK